MLRVRETVTAIVAGNLVRERHTKKPPVRPSVRPACGESSGGVEQKNKRWDKTNFSVVYLLR